MHEVSHSPALYFFLHFEADHVSAHVVMVVVIVVVFVVVIVDIVVVVVVIVVVDSSRHRHSEQ